MTETKKSRPRTFATAVAAWPDQFAAVMDDPCDDHLQSLCTLLDVMDGEIVRRWGGPGHGDRLASLAGFRAAATVANASVAAAVTESRSSAAKARMAARKEAES